MKGILTEDHAALNVSEGLAGKSYRPCNGTEGEIFSNAFCANCREFNPSKTRGCKIYVATMFFNTEDEEYPMEWVYGADGQPTCTAFTSKTEAVQG